MLVKPEGCVGCVLYDKGKGFVPDQTVKQPDYVIYGEAPGSTEVTEAKPFVGKAGFVLKQWLMRAVPLIQLAQEKGKISYCNVLRCLPPEVQGRPYPRGEEKVLAEKHCSQYMNLNNAKTVILCGESPQRFFFGEELAAEDTVDKQLRHDLKGVMGRIGRIYEKDGKKWVFAPHPAYILRQPALVQHGQMALHIATNVDSVVEPEYLSWETAIKELR